MPASVIDTGKWARTFQYELNQKLAADGLDASVAVTASDLSTGRRRRRLSQAAAATSQLKYTIVVMVPTGKDASEVMAKAKAAAEATAKDRDVLRRLLQLCLPADLLASLDIEKLIDAMIASTVVEAEASEPGAGSVGLRSAWSRRADSAAAASTRRRPACCRLWTNAMAADSF